MLNFPEEADHAEFLAPPMRIVSREEEKAHHRVEMQRRAEANDQMYMAKFAEANPELVAANIAFYAEREAERRKEDEEEDHMIEVKVDELFDQLEREGAQKSSLSCPIIVFEHQVLYHLLEML